MQAEDIVHLRVLHDPILNHGLGSSPPTVLLRWLEEELDSALKHVLVVDKDLRCSQKHGHMGVVATRVHCSLHSRLELDISHLVQRKRVHISSQGHNFSFPCPLRIPSTPVPPTLV